MITIHCPWCSKDKVPIKRGKIGNHVSWGHRVCIGVGQPITLNVIAKQLKKK